MSAAPPDGERNLWVIAGVVLVVFSGFAFVLPFLPLFARELGARDAASAASWAGFAIGVTPLVAGLMGPFWGRQADRRGPKRIVLQALAGYSLALLLTAFVTQLCELVALRIVVGLMGGVGPLGLAMATASVTREHTGRAVGLIQAAQNLSVAIGPLTGGFLADAIGIRATFTITACVCGLAFLLVAGLYREQERSSSSSPATPAGIGAALRRPRLWLVLVTLFLVNFVGRSFTPVLSLHLETLGVTPQRLSTATGGLMSAYAVAATISAIALGRAARRREPRSLLLVSLTASALAVLPMAWSTSFGQLLALAIVLGLASGGALTLSYTLGGLWAAPAERATAFGLFSSAALFGGALAPAVAGWATHVALTAVYVLDAAVLGLLALGLLFALPSTPGSQSSSREA